MEKQIEKMKKLLKRKYIIRLIKNMRRYEKLKRRLKGRGILKQRGGGVLIDKTVRRLKKDLKTYGPKVVKVLGKSKWGKKKLAYLSSEKGKKLRKGLEPLFGIMKVYGHLMGKLL